MPKAWMLLGFVVGLLSCGPSAREVTTAPDGPDVRPPAPDTARPEDPDRAESSPSAFAPPLSSADRAHDARFTRVLEPRVALRAVTGPNLPLAELGLPYAEAIVLEGGFGALTVATEGLPQGLTLRPSHARRLSLAGRPREAGAFDVVVHVSDAHAQRVTLGWRLDVVAPLTIRPRPVGDVEACAYFEWPLEATGGVPPYRFSAPGTLPEGLAIDADGARLHGSLRPGTYEAWLYVEDARGARARTRWRWSAADPDPRNRWLVFARGAEDFGPGPDLFGAFAVDVCLPRSGPPVLIGSWPTVPTGGLERSHDGRKVAFLEFSGSSSTLSVVDLSGPRPGPQRVLVPDDRVDWDYRFSPDDRWIVFRMRSQVGTQQLHRVEVDALNATPRPIGPPAPDGYAQPAAQFSDDSAWLAYATDSSNPAPGLFVTTTQSTAAPQRVSLGAAGEASVREFRWLPGHRLLVLHRTAGGGAYDSASLVEVQGPGQVQVTLLDSEVPASAFASYSISADGRRAYWVDDGGGLHVAYLDELGVPVRLVPGLPAAIPWNLEVAPEGDAVWVFYRDLRRTYVVETATNPWAQDLTALSGLETRRGVWSPDGDRLYFEAGPLEAQHTWVFDRAGSTVRPLVQGAIPSGIGPDGRFLLVRRLGQQEVVDTAHAGSPAIPYPAVPLAGVYYWSSRIDRHPFKLDGVTVFPTLALNAAWTPDQLLYRINLFERPLAAVQQHPQVPDIFVREVLAGACNEGNRCY